MIDDCKTKGIDVMGIKNQPNQTLPSTMLSSRETGGEYGLGFIND